MTDKSPRTWKQRALVAVSVVFILMAALVIPVGALLAVLSGSSEFAAGMQGMLAGSVVGRVTVGLTSEQTIMVIAALMFASGFCSLLCGILGIRSSRDDAKIMPYLVMSVLSFGMSVVSDVVSMIDGSFELSIGWALGLAFSLLAIWLGASTYVSHRRRGGLLEGEAASDSIEGE
jgi:membrane protein YqaA with SNARE-associated domain